MIFKINIYDLAESLSTQNLRRSMPFKYQNSQSK